MTTSTLTCPNCGEPVTRAQVLDLARAVADLDAEKANRPGTPTRRPAAHPT